ncbi:MAG: hypothetical protein Q4E53_02960 [Eubacteriales bacterium]|nr:hypothetical protein [Eubacteriales bacterium]
MNEKNVMIKKKCPFCFTEISNEEAGFLLRTDGARFISPALNDLATPKRDVPYIQFWDAMGVPGEQIDGERIIVDNEILTELNQELSTAGKNLAVKHYDGDNYGYTFTAREGALTLYSNTMICPHCHNALPQNFFRYDLLMVGLAGSVDSGKTVYLSSLMMDGFHVLQRENLMARNAAGNTGDPYRLEMEKNADLLFRQGICPGATSKAFRKPVFIEITYRLGEKVLPLIVAIYDVAGELIKENAGSGRTGFARHMDGFICMVDPAQMHLNHTVLTQKMPDEEQVLKKLRLLSPEEQIAYQQMSNKNQKQVMDANDFMKDSAYHDDYILERKAEIILDSIRSGLGETLLRNKYMALTLAKSDKLEEIGEIRSYAASHLLFEREHCNYGFFNMEHHFLRQEILSEIFDQKVFRLQRNLEDYKESSLFVVSALGCDTEVVQDGAQEIVKTIGKVQPIRVEEPLLWLVMKYMQERGWLD